MYACGIATTQKPLADRSWIAISTSAREPSDSSRSADLLNDSRLAHAAFIAETPIDEPGDDRRNVEALKLLVKKQKIKKWNNDSAE